MNLLQARKIADYLKSIQTMPQKQVLVGFIRDLDDVKKYGGFCVRIVDNKEQEICEWYKLTSGAYKSMKEQLRTDYSRYYREHGHLYYQVNDDIN